MPTLAATPLLDLLARARAASAESVHLAPRGTGHAVRFRLDGAYVRQPDLVQDDAWSVLTDLRLALDFAGAGEARGVAIFAGPGLAAPWQLEVALIPGEAGPAAVLRPVSARRGLGALGIDPADVARLRRQLAHPGGVLLVTGPRHSGKRTFLAACMVECVADQAVHAVAAEGRLADVPGAVIAKPDHERGYTALHALRRARGQVPDLLVLDRLHGWDQAELLFGLSGVTALVGLGSSGPAEAIGRVLDMGLEPWRVAGQLTGVVSLRRLARLCPGCRITEPAPSLASLKRLVPRLVDDPLIADWALAYRLGPGCAACQRGVAGHVPLAEVCLPDPESLREWVRLDRAALRRRLHARVLTLRERAVLRAAAGEVWLAEALRRTQPWDAVAP